MGRKRPHLSAATEPAKRLRVNVEQGSTAAAAAESTAPSDQQQTADNTDFMTVVRESSSENSSRNTRHIDMTITFTAAAMFDPRQQLEESFKRLYDRIFAHGERPSGILIQMYPPNFEKEFTIPLRPMEQNSPSAVAEAIIRINEEYNGGLDLFNGTSDVRIIAVWPLNPARCRFI